MYSKSSPAFDAEHHYALLTQLYTTAVIRHATLLFSIWSAKGWGPVAFTTMINPGPTPYLPPTLTHPDQLTEVHLERLTSISGIKRSQISEIVSQAHGPWLLHMGPRERIATLEAIAGFYGCFGYKRKEAYVLREILGCIMDLVVCGREQPEEIRIMGSARHSGLGIQGLSSPFTPSGTAGMVGVRENEIADGNESIMKVVKFICKTHGIDLEAVKVVDTHFTLKQLTEVEEDNKADDAPNTSEEEPLLTETIGWPELQIGIVREAIAVAEALPGTSSFERYASHLTFFHRLSSRRPVLFVCAQDFTSCHDTSGSKPVVYCCCQSARGCKEKRRPQMRGVLVWHTCGDH